jgi:hypothetical protein
MTGQMRVGSSAWSSDSVGSAADDSVGCCSGFDGEGVAGAVSSARVLTPGGLNSGQNNYRKVLGIVLKCRSLHGRSSVFGSAIRRFESFLPSNLRPRCCVSRVRICFDLLRAPLIR